MRLSCLRCLRCLSLRHHTNQAALVQGASNVGIPIMERVADQYGEDLASKLIGRLQRPESMTTSVFGPPPPPPGAGGVSVGAGPTTAVVNVGTGPTTADVNMGTEVPMRSTMVGTETPGTYSAQVARARSERAA